MQQEGDAGVLGGEVPGGDAGRLRGAADGRRRARRREATQLPAARGAPEGRRHRPEGETTVLQRADEDAQGAGGLAQRGARRAAGQCRLDRLPATVQHVGKPVSEVGYMGTVERFNEDSSSLGLKEIAYNDSVTMMWLDRGDVDINLQKLNLFNINRVYNR